MFIDQILEKSKYVIRNLNCHLQKISYWVWLIEIGLDKDGSERWKLLNNGTNNECHRIKNNLFNTWTIQILITTNIVHARWYPPSPT